MQVSTKANLIIDVMLHVSFFHDIIIFVPLYVNVIALDQSGGSTPKALKLYGIPDDAYVAGEASMFEKMHSYRQRIIKSSKFNGERIIAAILFENTLCNTVEGKPTAQYLWEDLNIVPILKIDEGLMPEHDGVQMMKEMHKLHSLLDLAVEHKVFGTKARSFIKQANMKGIKVSLFKNSSLCSVCHHLRLTEKL